MIDNLITRENKGTSLSSDDYNNNNILLSQTFTKKHASYDVLTEKNINVPQTNDTDYPMFVSITCHNTGGWSHIKHDGKSVSNVRTITGVQCELTAIIPPQSTYEVTTSLVPFAWHEFKRVQ